MSPGFVWVLGACGLVKRLPQCLCGVAGFVLKGCRCSGPGCGYADCGLCEGGQTQSFCFARWSPAVRTSASKFSLNLCDVLTVRIKVVIRTFLFEQSRTPGFQGGLEGRPFVALCRDFKLRCLADFGCECLFQIFVGADCICPAAGFSAGSSLWYFLAGTGFTAEVLPSVSKVAGV